MNNSIQVLEFSDGEFAYGGIESFLINMYKNFTNKNIKYTFCTPFTCTNKNLIELIKERKDNLKTYNFDFSSRKNRRKNFCQAFDDILSKKAFDVVHVNYCSPSCLIKCSKLAKKHGVKKIIFHSHIAGPKTIKSFLIKQYINIFARHSADIFLSCSDLAARWKFPDNIIKNKAYTVINNGIDIKKFTFNEKIREKYRNDLKIEKDFVICHVGRFVEQKNHEYIVKIAERLKNDNFKCKFILIGSGELKEQIIQELTEKNLIDEFIFLENRNDVAEIMMASDLFILPSLFEGLSVTSIEAQANGLMIIYSDTITGETNITDLCKMISLDNFNEWISQIKDAKTKKIKREKYAKIVAVKGYSAKDSANLLEKIYLEEK